MSEAAEKILRLRHETMIDAMRRLIDAMREAEEPREKIIMAEHRAETAEREFRARFGIPQG